MVSIKTEDGRHFLARVEMGIISLPGIAQHGKAIMKTKRKKNTSHPIQGNPVKDWNEWIDARTECTYVQRLLPDSIPCD